MERQRGWEGETERYGETEREGGKESGRDRESGKGGVRDRERWRYREGREVGETETDGETEREGGRVGEIKAWVYIALYPVRWTARSALHFPPLADLFIPTPTRLLVYTAESTEAS